MVLSLTAREGMALIAFRSSSLKITFTLLASIGSPLADPLVSVTLLVPGASLCTKILVRSIVETFTDSSKVSESSPVLRSKTNCCRTGGIRSTAWTDTSIASTGVRPNND